MMKPFAKWPLKSKIITLVAAPLVITVVLITAYHTVTGFDREKENIQNNFERLLTQAANAGELAFFAEDVQSLETLSQSIMKDSQVSAVLLYNEKRRSITQTVSGGDINIYSVPLKDNHNQIDGNQWYFVKAVNHSGGDFSDNPEQETFELEATTDTPIGWIVIAVDLTNSKENRLAILANNLLITLFTILAALWFALRFARSITDPLSNITQAINYYSKDDFSHRLDEVSEAELGQLEKGINKLASQVSESQQILKDAIARVRDQWIDAVNSLEKKNIDLISAKVRAEEANKSKDDFLARMSHELRTPLTAIMGFVNILERTHQPEVRKEYTDMILATSSVLLSTINDILDFSKLRSNAFKLHPESINLEVLIRNILDMHSISALKKQIELNLLIDSDVPIHIEADVDKLKKVVNNILANAIKFTESGDIVVLVSLDDSNSNQIAIEIKDSGKGIADEDLAHLFDPFYQCDQSSTRQHEGTGLGLSIAKDFVELMNGSISVDSDIGHGTEVRFSFDYQASQVEEPAITRTQGLKAVIYEQNPWSKRAWRNTLLKHANQVSAPHNEEKLEAELRNLDNNSLLLMGFNLSLHTEKELGEQLHKIRNYYSGNIILAVADRGTLDKDKYQATYSPLVITRKPLTQSRLSWAVDQFVGNRRSAGAPTEEAASASAVQQASPLKGNHILLAEDNEFNQRLFRDLLESAGATVSLANDGQEALRRARVRPFDLLLLDLRMPKIDGIKLSKLIRDSSTPNQQTPIMLLTADLLSSHDQPLEESGINAVCHKPVKEEQFFEQVIKLCGVKTGASSTPKRGLVKVDPNELNAEINQQLELLRKGFAEQNLENLKEQAHQLAGIIGISNLTTLEARARSLNALLEQEQLEQASEQFSQLEAMWEKTSV